MEGGDDQVDVRGVVDRLDDVADQATVSVRDVVEAFGETSFLPMLLVPSLLVVSPLSGVPLFSTLCGLSIALIASQMLARREQLWLPDFVMRRRIAGTALRRALVRLRRMAAWLDRHARKRLAALTVAPLSWLLHLSCLLAGLTMPVLEFVPFSSSIMGMATALFVVALLARDGVFAIGGWTLMAIAASVPVLVVAGITGA